MMKIRQKKKNERGASLVEFSIAATVFLTIVFAALEFGRVLWIHNALTDAARRGARYAVVHRQADINDVKNVVVYGDPAGGTDRARMAVSHSDEGAARVALGGDGEAGGGVHARPRRAAGSPAVVRCHRRMLTKC